MHQTSLALWLAKPSSAGLKLLLTFEDHPIVMVGITHGPFLQPLIRDEGTTVLPGDLTAARTLNVALSAARQQEGPVSVAVEALWRALCEPHWQLRYLLLWICIEALCGSERARGKGQILARRLAALVEADAGAARSVRQWVEHGYAIRNGFVHGAAFGLGRPRDYKPLDLVHQAERHVAAAARRVLLDPPLRVGLNAADTREEILRGLAGFSREGHDES